MVATPHRRDRCSSGQLWAMLGLRQSQPRVSHVCNHSTYRLRQKDIKFQPSPGDTARFCFKSKAKPEFIRS